jgi:hypothetical protein
MNKSFLLKGVPVVGSLNIIKCDNLPDGRSNLLLAANDPIRVKREIGLADVSENLFSTINSGVRFWPFLFVARDLDNTNSRQRIVSTLLSIQKNQPQQNIGPASPNTFDYYRSMYRRLKERDDPDSASLRSFIQDRRKKYVGDFKTFLQNGNERKWKKALVKSMGIPGKQFAKLLDSLRDKDDTVDIVEEALSIILRNRSRYDTWLWRGAFCYAFLRCMYGIYEADSDKPTTPREVFEWADLLIHVLRSGKIGLNDHLIKYIPLLEKSKKSPPWKKESVLLSKRNRRILSNLRFHAFYRLYLHPAPKVYR